MSFIPRCKRRVQRPALTKHPRFPLLHHGVDSARQPRRLCGDRQPAMKNACAQPHTEQHSTHCPQTAIAEAASATTGSTQQYRQLRCRKALQRLRLGTGKARCGTDARSTEPAKARGPPVPPRLSPLRKGRAFPKRAAPSPATCSDKHTNKQFIAVKPAAIPSVW